MTALILVALFACAGLFGFFALRERARYLREDAERDTGDE